MMTGRQENGGTTKGQRDKEEITQGKQAGERMCW